MALTVRKMSTKAENGLDYITERYSWINSKTKAIEHALEKYIDNREYINKMKKENFELHNELSEVKEELENIKRTITAFANICIKQK